MSDLPLLPIGYPGESETALASQQKALVLVVLILLIFADIEKENPNETFEFFLQVIVLIIAGVFCSVNR